ncbi:MAG TPA: hypothetical protein VF875_07135 [Anaeromyxobacter sp.]
MQRPRGMGNRVYMSAAAALVAALVMAPLPAASMALCFTTPYTIPLTLYVSPGSPMTGTTATITCAAGQAQSAVTLNLTVAGGTFDPTGITSSIAGTTETWSWTVPVNAGSYAVSCQAVASDHCGTGYKSISVPVGALGPVVSDISGPDQLAASATASYSVTAFDQNVVPQPLTYEWSATGGMITGSGDSAVWTAPTTGGSYEIDVTVTASGVSMVSSKLVNVVLASFQADLTVPEVRAPRRLAVPRDGFDGVCVLDGQQPYNSGIVTLLTPKLELRGFVALPEPALGITEGGGFLWVTTGTMPFNGHLWKADSATGHVIGQVPLATDLAGGRTAAYDPTRNVIWLLEASTQPYAQVRVVRPNGELVATIPLPGEPVDLAIDPGGNRAWVLLSGMAPERPEDNPNANPGLKYTVFGWDLDGNYAGPLPGSGLVTSGGGIAVGPDPDPTTSLARVYASDSFQGTVQVFTGQGVNVGSIGTYGTNPGQLKVPAGVAILKNGDVLVASLATGRIERFGSGTLLPASCQTSDGKIDTDCDGMSDAWEDKAGLNKYSALDALAYFRTTGYLNYDLYAMAAAGNDPLAGPRIVQSGHASFNPGFVNMAVIASAALEAFPVTSLTWRWVSGPEPVTLKDAGSSTPSFIARLPGSYVFEVVGATALGAGDPVRLTVALENVPPVADPGRVVVASPGSVIRLDARFSSDANGGTPGYRWDQTLGAALSGTGPASTLTLRPRARGLFKFQLTASDPLAAYPLAKGTAEVPVLVATVPVSAALAVANPAKAQVDQLVTLGVADESAFVDPFPSFWWEQLAGPQDVTLSAANVANPTFQPPAPGRYTFALTVTDRSGLRAPPATVDVYVGQSGPPPEIASATSDAVDGKVDVRTVVHLTASGNGTGYAWRQLAGPAAGINGADTSTPTAVPFTPGWYVFEVAATDGAAVGAPARVSFEARGTKALPIARVTTPGLPPVTGQLVYLDGSASTGGSGYRWTQVAGPWVTLSGQGAKVRFVPQDPGTYAFELEVDDGTVRSAPARVEIHVIDNGVN